MSMRDIYRALRWRGLLRSHRLLFLLVLAARRLHLRHLSVRFDPIAGCNLACRMCPSVERQSRGAETASFDWTEIERLADGLLPRALQFVIGCSWEPTIYPRYLDLLPLARAHGVPNVGLTTNGQLLDETQIRRLADDGLDELTISTHGVDPATYEELMPGASHARLLEVLDIVSRIRAVNRGRPSLRLNYTVCRENLQELDRFLDVYGRYRPEVLQIRSMFGESRPELRLRQEDLPRYRAIVDRLRVRCRAGNIRLLANTADPLHETISPDIAILPSVYLYVEPGQVWREDFAWREESYAAFCARIGIDRYLWSGVWRRRSEIMAEASRYQDSFRYDVR